MLNPQPLTKKTDSNSKPRYHPSQLNSILVNPRGSVMHLKVRAYMLIDSRFRTKRVRTSNGKYISVSRLNTDAWYTSKKELKELFGCSISEVPKTLRFLEDCGLILRDYEEKNGSYNKLKIYLLKDTPYFTNPNGIALEQITNLNNHTNHDYIKEKYGIDRVDKAPHLKLVKSTNSEGGVVSNSALQINSREEEALRATSSSRYSNSQNKKNNIYLVKNSVPEQPLKKSSFENDFYAYDEDGEIGTYCYDTAGNDMPEYATDDFGLPAIILSKDSEQTTAPEPISTIFPTQGKWSELAKEIQPELMIATKDENMPMELPTPTQNLRQRLNREIYRQLPQNTSESLQENLVITPIGPNKIGLKFNKKIPLKTDEKEQLRKCIKVVYGNNIAIIAVDAQPEIKAITKPEMPTIEDTANRGVRSPASKKWEDIKNDILNYIHENAKVEIKYALERIDILSLDGRTLKLSAKYIACNKLNDHQSLIEKVAKDNGVDIELKNTTDNDTLYFPWVFDSTALPPLTLEKN